ncbi:MAG: 30S ribosomal protein S12 methylthiotransferase RimO [Candidatus Margulisiibacteriota bacterium]
MRAVTTNTLSANSFHIISLGCPKNLTDSEVLMGQMAKENYSYTSDPALADIIIVNTCAFLSSARKESLQVIKEMSAYKKKGICKKLYVAGCLPKYLGKLQIKNFKLQKGRKKRQKNLLNEVDGFVDSINLFDCHAPRVKATPPWTAYIKISEGCDNNCAYCLIPSIRGKLRNRTVGDIIKQVDALHGEHLPKHRNSPSKEIIFIAQDTTAHPRFDGILDRTSKISGVKWIRVMYAHPKHLSDKIIDAMVRNKKVLKYIDLPMQHSSDKILKAMSRGYNREHLEALIIKLRKKMPGIAIRTTFIVGFPGETEKDFDDLADFIEKMKLDRVGVFPFSREKGTPAYNMKGQVAVDVARERHLQLMKLQAKISKEINKGFIGKKMDVMIETLTPQPLSRRERGALYKVVGRSYRDAPEIDGKIVIEGAPCLAACLPAGRAGRGFKPGDIVKVKITGAGVYDLRGYATN